MKQAIRWWLVVTAALFIYAAGAQAAEEIPVTGKSEPELAAFDRVMVNFLRDNQVPGGALAIARGGKIVYARGFGFADVEKREAVEPDALFRIASVSKPFTSAAILQLQERGKLKLDDPAFAMLGIQPHLEGGAKVDPRLAKVTIRQLLHHTGGFDRDVSFDPMFRSTEIARVLGTSPPAGPKAVIQYMMGRPLDFEPGMREAYSNYGYCVLGRVVEKASGMTYASYMRREILEPLGIHHMRLGRTLPENRAPGEVHYYPRGKQRVPSVFEEEKKVSWAYGGWYLEAMDSHGGWIASAPELARFASSLDDPKHCPILNAKSIEALFVRPKDTGYDKDGKPKDAYYACGWEVRPVGRGKMNTWHGGLLAGTASLIVRRYDGLTWAVVFNSDDNPKERYLGDLIDPLLHPVADGIANWPEGWEFKEEKENLRGP
ncbi:MAG: penicillin-binding protein beta-lactamase class [Phycisphaerales bacterium]|nr:penicillin-binding protein beta-lactamase class [Phycisphaerales bacterium]